MYIQKFFVLILIIAFISGCKKAEETVVIENDSYFTLAIDNAPEIKFENKIDRSNGTSEYAFISNTAPANGSTVLSFQVGQGYSTTAPYSNVTMSMTSLAGKPFRGRYSGADSLGSALSAQFSFSQYQSPTVLNNQYIIIGFPRTSTNYVQVDNFGLNKGDIVSGSYHFDCALRNIHLGNDTLLHTMSGRFKVRVK